MSNMDIVEDHSHTQEEADTPMLRLVNIILESCTSSYILVSSPDTDVFVLLLSSALTANHPQRGNKIFFRTGVKEKYRDLKMEHFISKLIESHVRGMIGFHASTGCDQIRKYNGTSKARLVKMYLSSTTDEVNCFEMLGQDNLLSHYMDTLNDGLSKFLTKAYTTQGITAANIRELSRQFF